MKKQKAGFFDVTSFFSDEELERLPKTFSKAIDNKIYYFKKSDALFEELVAGELYKFLNIPVVDQQAVLINGKYFLMSETYHRKFYKYFGGHDLIRKYLDTQGISLEKEKFKFNYNNLETIWDALLYYGVNNEDVFSIVTGLVYYYFMSVIINDFDFAACNWEIETNDERTFLAPKFDLECAFSSVDFISAFNVDLTDSYKDCLSSIKYFLGVSSDEYLIAFKILLEKCNVELLYRAIANIKALYGDDLISYLNLPENSNKIKNIIDVFEKQRKCLFEIVNGMESKR